MSNPIVYKTLNRFDLHRIKRVLPKPVAELMAKKTIFLGGGFIRSIIASEPINDIDLFVGPDHNPDDVVDLLKDQVGGGKPYKTENATTLRSRPWTIQVIHRWRYTTAEELIKAFDFTICQAAVWIKGDEWGSVCHPSYYEDLAGKRLIYTSPVREEAAGGSFIRALKYGKRGYRMPMLDWALVIERLNDGIEVGTPKRDRVKVLAGLLREVDPNDPLHEVHESSPDQPEPQEVK